MVITDCDHGTVAPELAVLGGHAEVSVHQVRDPAGLLAVCREADGVLTQYGTFTRQVIDGLSRCRVIARYGVGVDTVDVAAATARGIVVANVPDYATEEVSDHAVALILALHRRLPAYDRAVRGGRWDFRVGAPVPRLRELTVGIVGFGRIGRRVADKLRAFGVRCLATDPYVPAFPAWVEAVPLDALVAGADVVSLHCPLTPETRHLIDQDRLRRMKPTAFLVNTARGAVVDTAALVRALREGWIAGAGLDVFEEEPLPPDHPLHALDQVILTPHAAFYSEGALLELKHKAATAVLDVLQGRRPASVVNPEVLTAPAR